MKKRLGKCLEDGFHEDGTLEYDFERPVYVK